uniref:Uncharacterized protein n=1 Tax=Tetranychus urticae TaxID=32264 RepID=T1JWN3_TETUR
MDVKPDSDLVAEPANEEEELSAEEIEERRIKCNQFKQEGNEKFKEKCLDEAINLYSKAIDLCPLSDIKERSILFNNRAAKESWLEKCVADCTTSIDLNPSYVKPYLKRAQANRKIGKENLDKALEDYEMVLKMDPSIKESYSAINELKVEIDKRNEDLKNEMIGKLKDIGNVVLNKFGLSTDNFQMVKNPETGSYSINFKS